MARAGKMIALKVRAIARTKAPGYYSDGGGLFLQISRFGAASWVFRYGVGGRLREMGLGSLDTIGLANARARARKAREQRLDGLGPIELPKATRLAAQLDTRRQSLSGIAPSATSPPINRPGATPSTLRNGAPRPAPTSIRIFGNLAVQAVDVGLVLKVIEPIWTAKPETASRMRGRIETPPLSDCPQDGVAGDATKCPTRRIVVDAGSKEPPIAAPITLSPSGRSPATWRPNRSWSRQVSRHRCRLPLPAASSWLPRRRQRIGLRRSCGIGRRRARSGRHRQYGKTSARRSRRSPSHSI
jgi:Arm DNA-binding domain